MQDCRGEHSCVRTYLGSIETKIGFVAQALNDWIHLYPSVTTREGMAWNMDECWVAQQPEPSAPEILDHHPHHVVDMVARLPPQTLLRLSGVCAAHGYVGRTSQCEVAANVFARIQA